MPHSSGGGSHGGGSHSSHSSHSSGGSGGSSHSVKNSYFPGATRYVYYRSHRPTYVYANYDITSKPSPLRFIALLIYLPFLIAIITMFAGAIHYPQRLEQDYSSEVTIQDNLGIFGKPYELSDALNAFYKETGISPVVITVFNEDWQDKYSSLENYAYDLYVNKFYDEKHWLIVYSESYDMFNTFNDWKWEGMQGDDTDPILTEDKTNKFTESLQKYLTQRFLYTVDVAIAKAFDELTPTLMQLTINWPAVGGATAMLAFIIFHACAVIGINPKAKYYQQATICPDNAPEDTCDYCQGIYVIGTCTVCPHCGAPLKPHNNYYNDSF